MASIHEIKRRIKSVKNIAQVTRAMQMVAASRMRHAQEQALASRPYANKACEILAHLAEQSIEHPLLTPRESGGNIAIILITADKGLAGAYNSNVIRTALQFMSENSQEDARLITVGRRGRDLMARYGRTILAEFSDLPARPTSLDIADIARVAIDGFLRGDYDEVYLTYTRFVNTLQQDPTMRLLLPIQPGSIEGKVMRRHLDEEKTMAVSEYIYEPDPETLYDNILPRFTELQIYQAVLEALASEYSARMVAMRNATNNANDLVGELTLAYNKIRQNAITKEMLDIVGGAEALAQAF